MKEELISFETAKLAQEKGLLMESDKHYRSDGLKVTKASHYILYDCYPIVTQSLLQKWLREEHGIIVLVTLNDITASHPYRYKYLNKENNVRIGIGIPNKFKTYEEALEKALLESLKLIR
jgi:hypothetical protein